MSKKHKIPLLFILLSILPLSSLAFQVAAPTQQTATPTQQTATSTQQTATPTRKKPAATRIAKPTRTASLTQTASPTRAANLTPGPDKPNKKNQVPLEIQAGKSDGIVVFGFIMVIIILAPMLMQKKMW